jgi:WD40 repeat protein
MKKNLLIALLCFTYSQLFSQNLKLISPNGGEKYTVGQNINIKWEGISPSDRCKIEFSSNNGVIWQTISDSAYNFEYKWENIPQTLNNNCIVRVSQTDVVDTNKLIWRSLIPADKFTWAKNGKCIYFYGVGNSHFFEMDAKTFQEKKFHNLNIDPNHPVNGAIHTLAKNPLNNEILCLSKDDAVIWDIDSNKIVKSLSGFLSKSKQALYSKDASKIAFLVDSTSIVIWNSANNQYDNVFITQGNKVSKMLFSLDNKFLFTAMMDNSIKIWDMDSLKVKSTIQAHSDIISDLDIIPNSTQLASSSLDHTIKFWNYETSELIRTFEDTCAITKIDISNNAKKMIYATIHNEINEVNIQSLGKIAFYYKHQDKITSLEYSPDDSFILAGSKDFNCRVWQSSNQKLIQNQQSHTFDIDKILLSPNGNYLATFSNDSKIVIWNTSNMTVQNKIIDLKFAKDYNLIKFSNNSKYLIIYDYLYIPQVYDINANKIVYKGKQNEHLEFDTKGELLYVSIPEYNKNSKLEFNLYIWDLAKDKLKYSCTIDNISYTSQDFYPINETQILFFNDQRFIWDIDSNKKIEFEYWMPELGKIIKFDTVKNHIYSIVANQILQIVDFQTGKIIKSKELDNYHRIYNYELLDDNVFVNLYEIKFENKKYKYFLRTYDFLKDTTYTNFVNSIEYSPDFQISLKNKKVFINNQNGSLILYNLDHDINQTDLSDSTFEISSSTTSVKELATSTFTISPNPSSDFIKLDLTNSNIDKSDLQNIRFELMNMMGQNVLSKAIQSNNSEQNIIDIRAIPSEIYTGVIYSQNNIWKSSIVICR